MRGWSQTKLGLRCEIFSGYPFKSLEFSDDPDDVALVKGENVGQGEILWGISKRWPRASAEDLARYRLAADDVVLAMDRPWVPAGLKFARIRSTDPEALLVQRVARLRGSSGLDQRFLYYVIGSPDFVAYVKNAGRGVGVPHISGKQIGEYEFALPPLPIQSRTASILSSYDDLIETNRRRMALLEDAVRQLYREWFVRLRFPGHEHTKIIDGVPQGWARRPLEEAFVLQRGFDLPSQERQEGQVPVYGSTGVVGYHSKSAVKAPGVVTGRSGTIGEVHYVAEDYWPLNTSLWIREFKRLSPVFAVFLLQQMDLKQYNGGASVPTLDRKTVHKVQITIPPPKLISLFDDFAKPVFDQQEVLRRQNEAIRMARDLLLPRLMSGQLIV